MYLKTAVLNHSLTNLTIIVACSPLSEGGFSQTDLNNFILFNA